MVVCSLLAHLFHPVPSLRLCPALCQPHHMNCTAPALPQGLQARQRVGRPAVVCSSRCEHCPLACAMHRLVLTSCILARCSGEGMVIKVTLRENCMFPVTMSSLPRTICCQTADGLLLRVAHARSMLSTCASQCCAYFGVRYRGVALPGVVDMIMAPTRYGHALLLRVSKGPEHRVCAAGPSTRRYPTGDSS